MITDLLLGRQGRVELLILHRGYFSFDSTLNNSVSVHMTTDMDFLISLKMFYAKNTKRRSGACWELRKLVGGYGELEGTVESVCASGTPGFRNTFECLL